MATILVMMLVMVLLGSLFFGDNDQGIVLAENLRVIEKPKFFPVVDSHMHIDPVPALYDFALKVMDGAGIAACVNLYGGHGRRLEKSLALAAKHRGRFVTFCDVRPNDKDWASPKLGEKLAGIIRESHAMGAVGFGEVVKWGLYGKVRWDDTRLEPMWEALEELKMPINWHVADPTRYWRPASVTNCLEAPGYYKGFPLKHELIMQQERVLERHPKLVVIAAHANWLNDQIPHLIYRLETYPNYHFDLSAACDEFGRMPEEFYDLCVKYSGRIFFGTDPVYTHSLVRRYGGAKKAASHLKAFYIAHYLFLGTRQRMIPCAWKGGPGRHFVGYENGFARFANDGVALPDEVLKAIYYGNAERLFGIKVSGWRPARGFSYQIAPPAKGCGG